VTLIHREAVEFAIGCIPDPLPPAVNGRRLFDHLSANMHVPMVWTSLTTKELTWAHENETRLIFMQDVDRMEKIEVRVLNKRRFVEMHIPQRYVVEVMLGPRCSESLGEVEAFLTGHGYSIPVTQSAAF
jgi:hypothetical protein